MSIPISLSVIGGDNRQFYISESLADAGYHVRRFGQSGSAPAGTVPASETLTAALDGAEVAVLPLPVTRDGRHVNAAEPLLFSALVEALPPGCRVFAGRLPPAFKDCLEEHGVPYLDFYEEEAFVWRNAYLTAEGAVSLLMQSSARSLRHMPVLICGYGRIGKCLARLLIALDADVTVAARKERDRMAAEMCGCRTDRIDYARPGILRTDASYAAILNTVPGWIFGAENAGMLAKALYVELASAPYGGDPAFMEGACARYLTAPGLPGVYAPESAAEAILESLYSYIL